MIWLPHWKLPMNRQMLLCPMYRWAIKNLLSLQRKRWHLMSYGSSQLSQMKCVICASSGFFWRQNRQGIPHNPTPHSCTRVTVQVESSQLHSSSIVVSYSLNFLYYMKVRFIFAKGLWANKHFDWHKFPSLVTVDWIFINGVADGSQHGHSLMHIFQRKS